MVLQSLHKILPSTTSYYKSLHKVLPVLLRTTSYHKACTKYFPVVLGTTKLAQNTSQYYFVLQKLAQSTSRTTSYYLVPQSLHKVLPSSTWYYKSLHKVLPSTTSYYKACTKYFAVLLGTSKLAHSTSHYYLVLQSLHKVLPSTTSYYKACTKYFPVLLGTTKLAQSTSQYYLVLQSLHRRYLPSPAAATLHGKTQGFVLRLSPQHKPHATFMQPLHCDLQPEMQQTQRITRTHTRGTFHRRRQALYTEKTRFRAQAFSPSQAPCNIHAAITLRSATRDATNA